MVHTKISKTILCNIYKQLQHNHHYGVYIWVTWFTAGYNIIHCTYQLITQSTVRVLRSRQSVYYAVDSPYTTQSTVTSLLTVCSCHHCCYIKPHKYQLQLLWNTLNYNHISAFPLDHYSFHAVKSSEHSARHTGCSLLVLKFSLLAGLTSGHFNIVIDCMCALQDSSCVFNHHSQQLNQWTWSSHENHWHLIQTTVALHSNTSTISSHNTHMLTAHC